MRDKAHSQTHSQCQGLLIARALTVPLAFLPACLTAAQYMFARSSMDTGMVGSGLARLGAYLGTSEEAVVFACFGACCALGYLGGRLALYQSR